MTASKLLGRAPRLEGMSSGGGGGPRARIACEGITVPATTFVYPTLAMDPAIGGYDTDGFLSTATGTHDAPGGTPLLRIPTGFAGNYTIGFQVFCRTTPASTTFRWVAGAGADDDGTGFSVWTQSGGIFVWQPSIIWPLNSNYSMITCGATTDFDLIEGDCVSLQIAQGLAVSPSATYPLLDAAIWIRKNGDS